MAFFATKQTTKTTVQANPLLFIKEVAKYFMDFLETDFHKRQTPKRAVRFRNADNLMVGLNLAKYAAFSANVWKLINHSFTKGILDHIGKGVYRTSVPTNLLELVRLHISKISPSQLSEVVTKASSGLENAAVLYAKEYDRAVVSTMEAVDAAVRAVVVHPLISSLEKPLQNLELGDENNIYLMEEELTSVVTELFENKVAELLRICISKDKIDLSSELSSVVTVSELQSKLAAFFEELQVGDLFLELFELDRNRAILDKQELYLYFCDITFNKAKYPVFYIPFSIERHEDTIELEFDSQVYVNKRALDYIVQEVNQQTQRRGTLSAASERIIYLAQHEQDFDALVSAILAELVNVFELDRQLNISSPGMQVAKSSLVRVSNAAYIALFDKSDEALVNDYEEILQLLALGSDNPLAAAFNKLIEDFIHKEPESFNGAVEEEWDGASAVDRLVFESPIPLNAEQRQILSALSKEGCRYITVEGPPGTGKSHTITAVVFEAILRDQSVLVLSDKKEALDVVEDKITETMNRVRYDRQFQNPILRLGRTGSTYAQILSAASIENIKTHYRAVKKEHDQVEENVSKITNSLKEDLEAEILAYSDIDVRDIHETEELELHYGRNGCPIHLSEFTNTDEGPSDVEDLRNLCRTLSDVFRSQPSNPEVRRILHLLGWRENPGNDSGFPDEVLNRVAQTAQALKTVESGCNTPQLEAIRLFTGFCEQDLSVLRDFIQRYLNCKSPIFGYLFKGARLQDLDTQFNSRFRLTTAKKPHEILTELGVAGSTFSFIESLRQPLGINFDLVAPVHQLLCQPELRDAVQRLAAIHDDYQYFKSDLARKYPTSLQDLGISLSAFSSLCANKLTAMPDADFDRMVRYIGLSQKLRNSFESVPSYSYPEQESSIEDLVTVKMTYVLDGRVIDFYEHNRATAKALRDIIRSKQRFPKEEFSKLKKAFPCILAGIRDYAEYIPLEPEVFDLLIIDEASQVSIAQAFPALLRAKKILILGDKKQFSNIKAAQARSDTNREYQNNLRTVFTNYVARDSSKLVRFEKFNIKTSILEFFEFISNYHTQLVKHFRGYKELISYSNRYFYQDSLQVMKVRGKGINEVLQFSQLTPSGKSGSGLNTNLEEVDYIIQELKKLRDAKAKLSVGIITPHTNQQKLLIESISRLPERDYFFNDLRLKIMTFDTCQGEERDLVFYSMVATPLEDHLWGVFIKDLGSVDIEEEGKIKAQRLNVGFSRARECMNFVLSKPLDQYHGSVGEALRHYRFVLDEGKKEKSTTDVDPKSEMEPIVLTWFYQTSFWRDEKDHITLIPQFEIGKYLKQLDKTYSHPLYKVDFLLVYRNGTKTDRKIIIEYDGFREHFKDLAVVTRTNYQEYYSEDDVYRQKVLESYGYKFLRINKFNVGKNPIATLDERLKALTDDSIAVTPALASIHSAIEGLQNGHVKECPKCKMVRDINEFRDQSLTSGYGRFCIHCKKSTTARHRAKSVPKEMAPVQFGPAPCPRCGSKMILRKGRYGKFYGCSKYPYCRATRQVS